MNNRYLREPEKVELLPCPLCGGKVKPSVYYAGQDGNLPRISCNCGLKYEGLCSEESLARCWNRRKP